MRSKIFVNFSYYAVNPVTAMDVLVCPDLCRYHVWLKLGVGFVITKNN